METKINAQWLNEQLEQLRKKIPAYPVEFPGLDALITGASLAGACGHNYPSGLYKNAIRREQLAAEIATLANVSFHEVIEFCDSSGYSFEFIKAAVQTGAKLDKKDIRRTMEERAVYQFDQTPKHWRNLEEIIGKRPSVFIVTLPNNDHREVRAHYMETDGGALYFEDEDHNTILAFGPGHWVWAERKEDDQDAGSAS